MEKQMTLKIEGMSCQNCVRHVKKALEGVTGVTEVEVSLEKANAQVTFDPNLTGQGDFKEAVSEAGYEVVG
ncbi:MAG: heavy-metal-associated domain-containing protein [Anaerolineae bacterium]